MIKIKPPMQNADGVLSPMLEQTIVLWALMTIDQRLPSKVERVFGHLMINNVTLADLQIKIFQEIPCMLKELDENDSTTQLDSIEPELAAATVNWQARNRGGFGTRRPFRGRGPVRGQGNFRG